MMTGLKLTLLTLLALCTACASHNPPVDSQAEKPLRLLTYNIHHGAGVDKKIDLERIAAVMNRSTADLIAIQEVDRVVKRTGKVDQLNELARLTGMHPAFSKFMDYQGGEYGLAILSRYTIDRSWRIMLPPGRAEPRSVLAVRITHPQLGPITFICLHFDWIADDTQRYAQATALIKALKTVSGTVILAGDFNDRPGSRTLRLLAGQFTNAAKPEGARWTFPAPKPDREIDFIMYRSTADLTASARVLGESVASDHRPVLALFRSAGTSSRPSK